MSFMDFMKSEIINDNDMYHVKIRDFREWLRDLSASECVGSPCHPRRCPVFHYVKTVDPTVFAVVPGLIIFKYEDGTYHQKPLSFSISQFIKLTDKVFRGKNDYIFGDQLWALLESFAPENPEPFIMEEA